MRKLPFTFDYSIHTVKSKGKISQNFVAFSEYMNFKEAIFSLDESDRKGAEKFVKSMLEEKRLQMETWS